MIPPNAIQLGTAVLELDPQQPTSHFSNSWSLVTLWLASNLQCHELDQAFVEAIRQRVSDDDFGAQYKHEGTQILVRCWILPSNDTTSTGPGRMTIKDMAARKAALVVIISYLREDWNSGNAPHIMSLGVDDNATMAEIYASIPSPSEPSFGLASSRSDKELHRRLMNYEEPQGIRTTTRMYRYQFRSVARMLQMETAPGSILDPEWVAMSEAGRAGVYYLHPKSLEIRRDGIWRTLPCGGILSEQMGVGKSLMALVLILSTLHQPCSPPSNISSSSATTEQRGRTYPFPQDRELRFQIALPQQRINLSLPTLADLCVDLIARTNPNSLRSHHLNKRNLPHLHDLLDQRRPLYYRFPPPDVHARKAKGGKRPIERFHLAKSTLLLCPPILVDQWLNEIVKHLEDGSLSVLKVDKAIELPCIETLITYDVILMSVERFAMESRFPSVLLQARWKRLILDEGHSAGLSKTTESMWLAARLSVERRWMVSGTPTKHLQQGGEVSQARRSRVRIGRKWSAKDIGDVTSVGLVMENFLSAEPFTPDRNFQDTFTAPLRHRNGPRFGAIPRLRELLSAVMVKHAPNVIEAETLIPPCQRSTHLLSFTPTQRKTYNALAALITSNVYTSEANDRDYLLHPSNTQSFNQVISNLRLACLWFSAPEMGIAPSRDRTQKYLDKSDYYTPEVTAQLEEAVRHLDTALQTPGWSDWMDRGVSVPFCQPDLPELVQRSWALGADDPALEAVSLIVLRASNRPGKSEEELATEGVGWHRPLVVPNAARQRSGRPAQGTSSSADRVTAANRPARIRIKATKTNSHRPQQVDQIDVSLDEATCNAALNMSYGPRPLPPTVETISRSAKINFVIRTVLDADPTDKFVIFGDANELGHVTEAFELFEISDCYAGPGVSEVKREEALRRFRDTDVRACLTSLKLAARGLNLVAANRMILLHPVWSPDTLAQAVKRIHRIGQTQPTTVQILAMKGTIEEEIVNRGSQDHTDDAEKLYSRAMIENPRFVYSEAETTDKFTVHLIPKSERAPATPNMVNSQQHPWSPASPALVTPLRFGGSDVAMIHKDTGAGGKVSLGIFEAGAEVEEEDDDARPRKRAKVTFA